MALPNAGVPLSLDDIHVEVLGTTGTQVSLNDTDVRALISSTAGTQVSISDYYGASYNEFAGLIGASDTGDSFLYGFQTLNTGTNTIVGSEGLHTFNNMRESTQSDMDALVASGQSSPSNTYYHIPGWKRKGSWTHPAESSGGYSLTSNSGGWSYAPTGISVSDRVITILEYRIYTRNTTDALRFEDHNGLALGWGGLNFNAGGTNDRNRMYSFEFNTTDVNRGNAYNSSYSDKNNILNIRTAGRSTLTMMRADTLNGVYDVHYSNNGGSVVNARTGSASVRTVNSSWALHHLNAEEVSELGGNFGTCNQHTLCQGFLYVDRLISTTEMANVSNWLYNSSGVPNHTDETQYIKP